jgi:hypothetical protein
MVCGCATLLHKGTTFEEKSIEDKMCVVIVSTTLSGTFLILRRTELDIIINTHRSSCKLPLVLRFFNSLERFFYFLVSARVDMVQSAQKLGCWLFRFLLGKICVFSSKYRDRIWGSHGVQSNGKGGAFSGIERPRCEPDLSATKSADVKNECQSTSAAPCVFEVCQQQIYLHLRGVARGVVI